MYSFTFHEPREFGRVKRLAEREILQVRPFRHFFASESAFDQIQVSAHADKKLGNLVSRFSISLLQQL